MATTRILFWIGLVVLILGVVSLVVPIPNRQKDGVSVGGVSLAIETTHDEKVPLIISAVMILGGVGAMAVGKGKSA